MTWPLDSSSTLFPSTAPSSSSSALSAWLDFMRWAHISLELLYLFLPLSGTLFSQVLAWPASLGLDSMPHPQRRIPRSRLHNSDPLLLRSVPSPCFIFLHNTYYHLTNIYLLCVCHPPLARNVHEGRSFALLIARTPCLAWGRSSMCIC